MPPVRAIWSSWRDSCLATDAPTPWSRAISRRRSRSIFDNATDVLGAAGLSLADVVSARVFLTDPAHAPAAEAVLPAAHATTTTGPTMVVAALMNPAYLVEMTFVAMAGKRALGFPDTATARRCDRIPGDARRVPPLPVRDRRRPTPPAAIDAHARTATGQLVASLRQAGLAWADVADITLQVSDAAHAASGTPGHPGKPCAQPLPAGTTLVCGLLPHDARVQISAIAVG